MPSWVRYSLIRFGLFAVVFAGLLLLQLNPIAAALIAAVAGFCLAYIFFRPQRDAVVAEFASRRDREKSLPASDEAAEDPDDGTAPEASERDRG